MFFRVFEQKPVKYEMHVKVEDFWERLGFMTFYIEKQVFYREYTKKLQAMLK